MSVAFIGLGVMGAPMARNLLAAGLDVVGYNRSPNAMERHREAGGRVAASVADAVRGADVVVTMLPDSPDVERVALGDDGIVAHAGAGTLYIDCSTIRPDVSAVVSAAAAERGVRMLDAPVSGGEQAAIDGTLSIMVGGAEPDVADAAPYLAAMGATVVRVGGPGSGQVVKAANQLIVAGHLELLAEAIVLLDAHGIDLEPALRVIGGGLAGSAVLERRGAAMVHRNFAPGFRVDLHHKDLGIVLDAARRAGTVVPLGAVLGQLMAALLAQGDGRLDHTAVLRGVERLAGRA